MFLKIMISMLFIAVLIIRIVLPDLKIDTTSIVLIILATIPWVIQFIKSLEINGVGKVELVNKDKKKEMEENAVNAGLGITKTNVDESKQYSFINLRYNDPKLALAGLRIEIENSLRRIAENNSLDVSFVGIIQMTRLLVKEHLIDGNEQSIISDITVVLNKAVHSQLSSYESETFDWVFDLGISLLKSLNKKTCG